MRGRERESSEREEGVIRGRGEERVNHYTHQFLWDVELSAASMKADTFTVCFRREIGCKVKRESYHITQLLPHACTCTCIYVHAHVHAYVHACSCHCIAVYTSPGLGCVMLFVISPGCSFVDDFT